eukprot:c7191_g1_i2.p1 GENE.c7191_g1_i2~~c7191_g1_i2.p1  ORF type:complete len:231 (+),score=48.44 c7191_g1_i2:26-694(+)
MSGKASHLRETVLIRTCALRLKLGIEATTCALGLFHAFSESVSALQFEKTVVAAACLLLASKGFEETRRLRDVLSVAAAVFSEGDILCLDKRLLDLKQRAIACEDQLLRILGYEIPRFPVHTHIMTICSNAQATKRCTGLAFALATDSLLDSRAFSFDPLVLATACVDLSRYLIVEQLPGRQSWWEPLALPNPASTVKALLDVLLEVKSVVGGEINNFGKSK